MTICQYIYNTTLFPVVTALYFMTIYQCIYNTTLFLVVTALYFMLHLKILYLRDLYRQNKGLMGPQLFLSNATSMSSCCLVTVYLITQIVLKYVLQLNHTYASIQFYLISRRKNPIVPIYDEQRIQYTVKKREIAHHQSRQLNFIQCIIWIQNMKTMVNYHKRLQQLSSLKRYSQASLEQSYQYTQFFLFKYLRARRNINYMVNYHKYVYRLPLPTYAASKSISKYHSNTIINMLMVCFFKQIISVNTTNITISCFTRTTTYILHARQQLSNRYIYALQK
eukprot:TRINITY_DN1183_c1_g1_i1.p1 TRINITY_DN1183_c1_g1~~TRINITY_DN1183_c1_g1_i1.p1  ORF type:complete len:280 (+),score=-26.79 TRINITY_DN1183_c1_g1_i1:299-1138(+)